MTALKTHNLCESDFIRFLGNLSLMDTIEFSATINIEGECVKLREKNIDQLFFKLRLDFNEKNKLYRIKCQYQIHPPSSVSILYRLKLKKGNLFKVRTAKSENLLIPIVQSP